VDPEHDKPEESSASWFQPERTEPDRAPEPRVAGSRAGARHAEPQDEAPQNAVRTQPVTIGPRSGQPLPPLPPDLAVGSSTQENPQYHAQPVDRDTLRRARGGLLRLGDGVYRGRRPALLAVMAVLTVLFEVAFFRVFANGFRQISASGIIASTLMIIALPMFAVGMYALAGGAAVAPGQGVRAWVRTPLAYLTLSLLLFLAAALAAA